MRKTIQVLSLAGLAAAGFAPALAGDFHPGARPPADAQPGQCFGRVTLEAPGARSSKRVLVSAAHDVVRHEAPVTRWAEKRELVKAAWTTTTRIPAVYKTEVSYTYEPGARRVVATPPKRRKVVSRVLVSPARVVWRPGKAPAGYGGGEPGAYRLQPTGEVWCRVKIPARYVTKVTYVQTAPGCRCEVEGPPVRKRVTRRVLVTPERTVEKQHPAVYRTMRTCEIVRSGRTWVEHAPARYRTETHVSRVERDGWAPVVCPDGLAPWAMARLQNALNARGYDAGPEDGQGRPQTYAALARWQRDHGMATGQITVESARALGVVR